MAITKKRRVFIEEYFRCSFNATEAARRAGYKHPNVKGSQLVKVSEIAAEIQKYIDGYIMGREEVLFRLAEIARGEHGRYITETGSVDFAKLVEDGKAYLIKGVRDTAQGKSIEFYDGQKALVDIGRHHQLFTDNVDVKSGGEPLKFEVVYVDPPPGDDDES